MLALRKRWNNAVHATGVPFHSLPAMACFERLETQRCPTEIYGRFGETYCLYLQSRSVTQHVLIPWITIRSLKTEAVRSSETSVNIYHTRGRRTTKDSRYCSKTCQFTYQMKRLPGEIWKRHYTTFKITVLFKHVITVEVSKRCSQCAYLWKASTSATRRKWINDSTVNHAYSKTWMKYSTFRGYSLVPRLQNEKWHITISIRAETIMWPRLGLPEYCFSIIKSVHTVLSEIYPRIYSSAMHGKDKTCGGTWSDVTLQDFQVLSQVHMPLLWQRLIFM
jgi:hypothetical protein